MTYEELLGWYDYLEKRPVGWREDDRIYKVLQTQGAKEKPWAYFSSLDSIYNGTKKPVIEDNLVSSKSLKNSVLFSNLIVAKGGDKLEL